MKNSILFIIVSLTLCQYASSQNGYSNSVPQIPFGYIGNGGGAQFGSEGYQYGNNGGQGPSGLGAIPGQPGQDYPVYATPPETSFKCDDYEFPGYYADPEAQCQVFHICQTGNRKDSFLCPNGTLFNQQFLVCDWWNHVDCNKAQEYYSINEYVYQEMQAATQRLMFEAARRAQMAVEEGYSYNTPSGYTYPNGNGNSNGNTNGNANANTNGNGNSNRNVNGYSNGNGNGGNGNGYSNNNRNGYVNGNGNSNGKINGNGNGYSNSKTNGNGNRNGYSNGNGNGNSLTTSVTYLPPGNGNGNGNGYQNNNGNGNGNGNKNGNGNGYSNGNGYQNGNGNNGYSNGNGAASREYLPPL